MNEFELEDFIVDFLLSSELFKTTEEDEIPFLKGNIFKSGTRTSIGDEDVLVEVLSIDDAQFQSATVSVKIYVDDLNVGSPKLVPNTSRLKQISSKFEETFKSKGTSYCLTTDKLRMKLYSIKRERKSDLKQHCVNCLFNLVIINF